MSVTTEEKRIAKNNLNAFKKCADVENFYRFVSDHALRKEAKLILEDVVKLLKKKGSGRKKKITQ